MNGIYVSLLVREIRAAVVGRMVSGVFQQGRRFSILLDSGKALLVSLDPSIPAFCLTDAPGGMSKTPLFHDPLAGSRIHDLAQDHLSPAVKLMCVREFYAEQQIVTLEIILFRDAPNLVIGTPDRERRAYRRLVRRPPLPSIVTAEEADLHDARGVAGRFAGIDRALARELTADRLRILRRIVEGEPYRASLISASPLTISLFAGSEPSFASMNDLIRHALGATAVSGVAADRASAQVRILRRLERRLSRMKQEVCTEEDIELLRVKGESLLIHAAQVSRGSTCVDLVSPYDGKTLTIELDPALSARANAQQYFRQFKRKRRGKDRLRQRIAQAEAELRRAHEGSLVEHRAVRTATKPERPRPFREYRLAGGAVVMVGKNARANAELTFKCALPDDYFFHVRGYEGAHVILQNRARRRQRPAQSDIAGAAAIAAYYSKAKRQRNVAVSYTQRKYLKRSRQGKIGAVILLREEVVFVDPGLPEITPATSDV